jgi:hypothetical protein
MPSIALALHPEKLDEKPDPQTPPAMRIHAACRPNSRRTSRRPPDQNRRQLANNA